MRHCVILCLFMAGVVSGEEWVTGEVQRDTNFAEYVAAYTRLVQEQTSFTIATSVWYHCAARGLEVYTRNHDLSVRIRSLVQLQGSALVARLQLQLPRSFECQIYVYRDKAQLRSHLPEDLQAFSLERWHEGTAALTYQLNGDGTFNRTLLSDDVPYLLSIVLLEEFDTKGTIPAALRYGIAFATQKSVTNALLTLSASLAEGERSDWMPFDELLTFNPDPRDEPRLLRSFNLTSGALAAYLGSTTPDRQLARLLRMLAQGIPPEQAFSSTLPLGTYDVVSRLEEEVYNWVKENFVPEAEPEAPGKVSHRTTVSLAVVAVVVAVGVTLTSWMRQLLS
jgi:hypothetical protein